MLGPTSSGLTKDMLNKGHRPENRWAPTPRPVLWQDPLELLFNLARDIMFSSVGPYVVLEIAAGRWFGSVVCLLRASSTWESLLLFWVPSFFALSVSVAVRILFFCCGLVSRPGAHLRLSTWLHQPCLHRARPGVCPQAQVRQRSRPTCFSLATGMLLQRALFMCS